MSDNHNNRSILPIYENERQKKSTSSSSPPPPPVGEKTKSPVRINRNWFSTLCRNLLDFLKTTWVDWATIVLIGAVMIGVWFAPHTFTRYFPVTDPDHAIYWPEIAHPYVTSIFSPTAAGIIAAAIPIFVFAVAQIWLQSFVDFAAALLGLAYSMVTGTCFQVILKKTIGGLRPHFLAVCEPVLPPADGSSGTGYMGVMYTVEQVCTGDPDRIKNALESFPSGHAEVAFAGLGYLAIYLFAHLQITRVVNRRSSYWKMLFVIAPLLLATYLSSTLVLGYHHHGYDVVAGALIGWLMAFMGYRSAFMGIVDARWNTVPYLKLKGHGRDNGVEDEDDNGVVDMRSVTVDGDGESPARPSR